MHLDGKVALVTGAASGIGHAIAKRYLEVGGRVGIADLNLDAATAAARSVGDSKSAMAIAMNVADEEQVKAGVEASVAAFGNRCPRVQRGHPDCASDPRSSLCELEAPAGH